MVMIKYSGLMRTSLVSTTSCFDDDGNATLLLGASTPS
uniref:Uncharacterized protein n=1 Tax=Arundo donax TaxID=35708 RepID=A0A0A9BIX1_ARUDO